MARDSTWAPSSPPPSRQGTWACTACASAPCCSTARSRSARCPAPARASSPRSRFRTTHEKEPTTHDEGCGRGEARAPAPGNQLGARRGLAGPRRGAARGGRMREIRILRADDHAVLRAGLRALIDAQPDMRVVAEAGDGVEALRQAQETHPDVAIVDISMPELSGIDA